MLLAVHISSYGCTWEVFPRASITWYIRMLSMKKFLIYCHCFKISHITSNRTFWGLLFGSEIFWVLIFAPIRSFLLLEIWSTPLLHTDYYCSEKALTIMYTSALYLPALCVTLTPADLRHSSWSWASRTIYHAS